MPLADFQNAAGKYLILASDGNWFLDDLLVHRFPFYRLDINTRAVAIGGFTPLAHGVPAFYIGFGDATPESEIISLDRPVPFAAAENLPRAKTYAIPQRMD